jgi:large subunit ribosomal protein L47
VVVLDYEFICYFYRSTIQRCALLHTTPKKHDLMEFFDDPRNWSKDTVKAGRSWLKDELRIKSNEDLHKLW